MKLNENWLFHFLRKIEKRWNRARTIFHAVKKVIVISRREIYISRRGKSGVDGYTGVCYCVSLLKNTQLQFVSFVFIVFIEQFFIYENATECSQVLSLHDERDIYF